MNYIELVNQFWRLDMEHNFPCTSTRLYFGLLNLSNKLGWKNPFGATNQQLAALVQCDEKTLIRCRKVLVKTGLISVKRGCKNTPNSITLNAIHWKYSSENASENVPINDRESASHHKTETETKTVVYMDQVEEVFKLYPRRVGKKPATDPIKEAIRNHGYEFILEKTKAYSEARKDLEMEFTPHPSTWFRQERFMDDPATWVIAGSQSRSSQPTTPYDARQQLELVNIEIKTIKERHAAPEPGGGYHWNGVPQHIKDSYKRLVARRKELKPIAMGL